MGNAEKRKKRSKAKAKMLRVMRKIPYRFGEYGHYGNHKTHEDNEEEFLTEKIRPSESIIALVESLEPFDMDREFYSVPMIKSSVMKSDPDKSDEEKAKIVACMYMHYLNFGLTGDFKMEYFDSDIMAADLLKNPSFLEQLNKDGVLFIGS
ncbi:hypothetical protein [Shewanella aestuarii]|uniref:Uncharacterized protein n=1 Tax=Shewanella aestuarii TaxID=1028752 RepID=A0ABT0L5A8_9GAMM|nr:hypothetical protein [Shewanella aestuarii]MCL1118918.1 hypothetical protein [Shewanella aestuarii]GGN84288.1 hypothetical protein GCM10009193_33340 [Shewanella aestuarii]